VWVPESCRAGFALCWSPPACTLCSCRARVLFIADCVVGLLLVLAVARRMLLFVQLVVGRWECNGPQCKRMVEYDGSADALFSMRRRDKQRRWVLFTRALLDKLYSFIITSRSTYTAARRHLSSDVLSFSLRRQDLVKLGTAMLRTFVIPPEAAVCPLCGPNPYFIVIDGQSLGCTDPYDANPARLDEEVPVLDIAASALCIVQSPPLRAAITKVLRSSTALTGPQSLLLGAWHNTIAINDRASVETAAARLFFRFFPYGGEDGGAVSRACGATGAAGVTESGKTAKPAACTSGRADPLAPVTSSLESKLRTDGDGNLTLGGKGAPAKLPSDSWQDRVGHCAPAFDRYPRRDDGAWLHVRPFLQALLGETVSGMFHGHDEGAARLLANCLRLQRAGKWRDVTDAVDSIGFLTNFVGWFADELDDDGDFRYALGSVLLNAVDMELAVDKLFSDAANKKETLQRGWVNADYCKKWGGMPTPADYKAWRLAKYGAAAANMDDPLVSFESFPGLDRVRPGVRDSDALKRRVAYKGKDRHAADVEGDGDACNKAFSIKCGLTQGVFNVVCPHVITLGFRCMFRAESVGEALSIVLERFPRLPKVIFYDVACKLDKNALRRVRPILRKHGVRCILDRPHSITHSCSPIYMPDESLGATAGVATQAAEVSHSIAVANRTSLAYMSPTTYMTHKVVQVAMMNIRKLQRLSSANTTAENDHVPLAPFFHSQLARQCQRGSTCSCQASIEATGNRETETALQHKFGPERDPIAFDVPVPVVSVDGEDGDQDHPLGDAQAGDAGVAVDGGVRGGVAGDAGDAPVGSGAAEPQPCLPNVTIKPMSTAPLPYEHESGVDGLVAGRPPAMVVRAVNKANIVLTVADFRVLTGEKWLNDAVMNSLVALINHRAEQVRCWSAANPDTAVSSGDLEALMRTPRTFMHNTFFFSRLQERAGCYEYAGVRTWGYKNGLDIGAIDRVLIPVNVDNLHWVLVVVDIRARQFLYYDSYCGGRAASVLPVVRRWLRDEVAARLGGDVVDGWEIDDWAGVMDVGLPQQSDGGSCGVFVMAAADCFALGAPLSFAQADMPVLRQRIGVALYVDSLTAADACARLPVVSLADTAVEE